jgi:hypothetical protein
MENMNWIKELVRAEQQLEESGMVDVSLGFNDEATLAKDTLDYLNNLKTQFVDMANFFNEMKPSALGRIKVYGIAQTQADFMLFRNGFKMIFSMKAPGLISIRINFIGTSHIPTSNLMPGANQASNGTEEHMIEAKWGAFGELFWTYRNVPVKSEYVVRYHMTLFVKESAK